MGHIGYIVAIGIALNVKRLQQENARLNEQIAEQNRLLVQQLNDQNSQLVSSIQEQGVSLGQELQELDSQSRNHLLFHPRRGL